jgi:crotonobetainyl-CoA:carnitine CoA-transferase CaiB-like acyl-CoA transferase
VWWAPAQGPAQVLEDPQLAATDGYLALQNEDGTTARSVNGPVSFSDVPVRPAAPAPRLGEHTDEVLSELLNSRTTGTRSQPRLAAAVDRSNIPTDSSPSHE